MAIATVVPWKQAEADALEAKAESVELALERLNDLRGLYADDSGRRHELRSFSEALELDAANFRAAAARLAGAAPAA